MEYIRHVAAGEAGFYAWVEVLEISDSVDCLR